MRKKIIYLIIACTSLWAEVDSNAELANSAKEKLSKQKIAFDKLKSDYIKLVEKVGHKQLRLICGFEAQRNEFRIRKADRKVAEEKYDEACEIIKSVIKSVEANKAKAKIKTLSETSFQMGDVTLDMKRQEVSFDARIPTLNDLNVTETAEGMLDVGEMPFEVVIGNPHARIYESLFLTEARAFHLQTLMLMAGFKNGSVDGGEVAKGDSIDILVKYTPPKSKKQRTVPIEHFMFDTNTNKPMERYGWIFVGSSLKNSTFVADWVGELVVNMAGETILMSNNKTIRETRKTVVYNDKAPIEFGTKVKIIFRKQKKQVKK